ncbi:hypothetical protein KBC31_01170 [Candidatus Saccharibacteria bacterium]|jgi:hypothetical protein|nr:hypothetical protein [Candidatus Saccharibacteria bacterium]
MAKTAQKRKQTKKKHKSESTSIYFLKILLFFIIGTIWIRPREGTILLLPGIPIGLLVGFVFATHDHFQIDRKVELAILLGASVLSFVAPIGAVYLL